MGAELPAGPGWELSVWPGEEELGRGKPADRVALCWKSEHFLCARLCLVLREGSVNRRGAAVQVLHGKCDGARVQACVI